ncbi:hypothetical protein JXL21_06220, partial [Candidatus Bathyarchaeota archaeon]|nr:hypothetical protein [Candidatus Bathyarchaeota archaeon]
MSDDLKPSRYTFPLIALILILLAASYVRWEAPHEGSTPHEPTVTGFTMVDPYPLYVATYNGDYGFTEYLATGVSHHLSDITVPGCTVFYACGENGGPLMGRNFDFPSNPALLLYTDPPDGYASVSMVDLGYFGYSLTSLPEPDSLDSLLAAPYMPFDGMNEKGLVVGMAAIPE